MARQPKSFWVPAICDCSRPCGSRRKPKVSILRPTKAVVQRYVADASDEEWITLMGQIGRTADPGLTCLKRAFESVIARGAPAAGAP